MKILTLVARIVTGMVFIFSGLVKAIDPLGSAYKFHDYFSAFNIGFLKEAGLPFAILLCTLEFLCGLSVLTGIRGRTGLTVMAALMVIFTPVTLVLALTNPVSDCGCFGDAIHLTNWQTFFKNVILLFFVIILLLKRKQLFKPSSRLGEWIIISGGTVIFIAFAFYNLRYLPVIDFLPYKKGVNIPEAMKIPEGAASDEYSTTFIYEKQGIKKEFTLADYPANDSTWKFIDQRSKLISKGYTPPVHDFSITTLSGENITSKVLNNEGLSVLMISKKLAEADKRLILEGFGFGRYCKARGIDFYVLTASGTDETNMYPDDLQICNTDETTLKTMVRSNPGYILLKKGTIIDKWSWALLKKRFASMDKIAD